MVIKIEFQKPTASGGGGGGGTGGTGATPNFTFQTSLPNEYTIEKLETVDYQWPQAIETTADMEIDEVTLTYDVQS